MPEPTIVEFILPRYDYIRALAIYGLLWEKGDLPRDHVESYVVIRDAVQDAMFADVMDHAEARETLRAADPNNELDTWDLTPEQAARRIDRLFRDAHAETWHQQPDC